MIIDHRKSGENKFSLLEILQNCVTSVGIPSSKKKDPWKFRLELIYLEHPWKFCFFFGGNIHVPTIS